MMDAALAELDSKTLQNFEKLKTDYLTKVQKTINDSGNGHRSLTVQSSLEDAIGMDAEIEALGQNFANAFLVANQQMNQNVAGFLA